MDIDHTITYQMVYLVFYLIYQSEENINDLIV